MLTPESSVSENDAIAFLVTLYFIFCYVFMLMENMEIGVLKLGYTDIPLESMGRT